MQTFAKKINTTQKTFNLGPSLKSIFKKILQTLKTCGIKNKTIVIIISSSIITIFFEILGIGIFIPVIEILSSEESQITYFGKTILIESYDKKTIYKFMAAFVFFVMFLKSSVLILNSYIVARFWSLVNEKVSVSIYKNILGLDYKSFTKKNNMTFSNIVVVEAEKFTELTKYSLVFFVEIFVLITLSILLFSYNFMSSLVVFVFLTIILIIIYYLSKGRTQLWGTERQFHQNDLQNNVKSGLMSYLSIHINGGLDYFLNSVETSLSNRNSFIRRQFIFENIPRNILELSGIIVLIIIAITLNSFANIRMNEILSFMGFLGISFYRILPSINRLISSFNQIYFLNAALEIIRNYLNQPKKYVKTTNNIRFKSSIIFENVSFSFDKKKKILDNISFELKKGEILGIFGKSGVGKSTLIKLLMGIIRPSKGNIIIDSSNLNTFRFSSLNSIFGYVEQNVRIFSAKLYENIIVSEKIPNNKLDWYNKVIKICQLQELDESMRNEYLVEDGHNLSGGQIQRIGLARALYKNPPVLVLDEFSSALDTENKNRIVKSIKEISAKMGTSIVIISHDNSLKAITDKIINL